MQKILNEAWPPAELARAAKDHEPVDVIVRIEWELDGVEQLSGRATRWTDRHVMVHIGDPRFVTRFVWVAAGDVRRR